MQRIRRLGLGAASFVLGRDRSGPAPKLTGAEKVYILVAHGYVMGGTIRTVFNTAEWLARRHEVEIVSATRARETTFFPLPTGVRITALDDVRKGHELTAVKGWLRRSLSRVRTTSADPDATTSVRWNLWTDLLLFRWLRSLENCVLITTRPRFIVVAGRAVSRSVFLIGQEHLHARAHKPGLQAVIKSEYQHLDVLTVLTEEDKRVYEGILAETRVHVVRMPNASRRSVRNVATDARRTAIVAAGRLVKVKGFDLLIEAWSLIEHAWLDWTVEIYGGGAERNAVQTLISEKGLAGRVNLMGAAADMATVFEKAGMFVLSSRLEGFGMVLIEAMAAGCPVVSFDCPTGPREVVHDGVDGILVPAEDVEKLAAAIQQMLEDPRMRQAYSVAGRESARSFSMEAVGARWDELLSPETGPRGDQGEPTENSAAQTRPKRSHELARRERSGSARRRDRPEDDPNHAAPAVSALSTSHGTSSCRLSPDARVEPA
jgi:glycosyltransferase involved in cell wall biosynthesis